MPVVDIASSPLAPGVSPVRIHYRATGAGSPLLFLHGGWGYGIYPIDRQVAALADRHRIVIPDRSGYGGSGRIDELPADFHRRALEETRAVVEALGLERPVLWGHSDGAIVALLYALAWPDRVTGVIVEAMHYLKRKPSSRAFFEEVIRDPRSVGPGVGAVLERDHGATWPRVIELHARAWMRIADEARSDDEDFYARRLGDIAVPVLVVHGARDPRTEPGEMDAVRRALGSASVVILPDGGHSPHSERATADTVTTLVDTFLRK